MFIKITQPFTGYVKNGAELWQLKCDSCKTKFIKPSSWLRSKRYSTKTMNHYCSDKCKHTHQSTPIKKCDTDNCTGKVSVMAHHGRKAKFCTKCVKRTNKRRGVKRSREKLFKCLGNKCVVCGENDPIYFHVDHINNDGHTDRYRSVRYIDYKENPHRFQLMCANCNWAKHMNGGKIYKPKKKRKVS